MDSEIEEERLLGIIFQHLVMFQYYKDLKEHDNYISNLFKCEPTEVRKDIDCNFLETWIEKCAIHKSENEKLLILKSRNADSNGVMAPLKKQEFIKLFVENSSRNFSWENAEVPEQVFFFDKVILFKQNFELNPYMLPN